MPQAFVPPHERDVHLYLAISRWLPRHLSHLRHLFAIAPAPLRQPQRRLRHFVVIAPLLLAQSRQSGAARGVSAADEGRAADGDVPGEDAQALATGGWALAHGLAFLHLDGKLAASSPGEVEERVRAAFDAVLAVRDGSS